HHTKHIMEGGMTQHRHRALTSAVTVLSLAIVAAPLTIDQRGSVGISQALAKGSHQGHSASRAGSGEGSPNDVVADAKEKKAASEASEKAAITTRGNRLLQQLDGAELNASSELARLQIEREIKAAQTAGEGFPNDAIEDANEKKAAIEASQDAVKMAGVNRLLQQLDAAELKLPSGSAKVMIEQEVETLQAHQKKV